MIHETFVCRPCKHIHRRHPREGAAICHECDNEMELFSEHWSVPLEWVKPGAPREPSFYFEYLSWPPPLYPTVDGTVEGRICAEFPTLGELLDRIDNPVDTPIIVDKS